MSGLAVVAATALTGTTTAVAASGVMTPAIGAHPHYKVAGKVSSIPADTTFSCQLTTPAQCYGPNQIRAAYGVDQLANHGLNGAGRTIVIVDAFQSPTITQDLATFDSVFGLPAPKLNIIAPDGLTPFDQSNADQTSWAGEISLDVEYSHAIAPAATIDLVLAKSDNDADIFSAQKFVVDHNLGDTLSQSFGEAEQCQDPTIQANTHKLYQKAAAEGITVFASSADQGAALPTCDGTSFFKAVSTPASDPLVTGVGGTILDANGTTGAYNSEVVWNEPDFAAAGGGGFSTLYKTPAFQRGANHNSMRGVPDVAYNAAIIGGVLTVWSTSGQGANLIFQFGGTSAGSPQWAGLAVLADQLGHHRVGNINNALYGLARGPLYGALYHDITVGDNTFHGPVTIQGFSATKGWDPASGLGSPKANNLVPALALTSF
jgi:subtilase family serine protease